ncbi:unnamed protein product, partial [Sphacelaria rigidula]
LDRLRDEICRLSVREGLFPNVGQKVPKSWRRVWAMAAALHEGGKPARAVRSYGEPVVPDKGYRKHNFVTKESALETWSTVVEDLELKAELKGRKGKNPAVKKAGKTLKEVSRLGKTAAAGKIREYEERVLQDALNMRHTGGTLLFVNDLIHLHPCWINRLLRKLLDHQPAEVEETENWRRDMMNYCSNSKLNYDEQVDTHRNFLISGRLSKDYLGFLWRDFPDLDQMVLGRIVDTMSTYGAIFPCGPKGKETTEFVVPARLPCTVAGDTLDKLKEAISGGNRERFTFRILDNYVPPGIIAQVIGRFYGDHVIFRACWSKGA